MFELHSVLSLSLLLIDSCICIDFSSLHVSVSPVDVVLLKAEGRDGEATRVLVDDVHDSIADMVQIMQSYRSKNMLSRVFVSSLFKKRQEEAEESINACVQRLQVQALSQQ